MLNNCSCDNLPSQTPQYNPPVGLIGEFVCNCKRRGTPNYMDYLNKILVPICHICTKPKEPVRKCRLCDALYVYIGRPLLCSHYPSICRDCLREGALAPYCFDGYDAIISTARRDCGLYYRTKYDDGNTSLDDIDNLLKEIDV